MNAEQSEIIERLREAEERAANAGARLADDFFCAGCGDRGYRTRCPRCQ